MYTNQPNPTDMEAAVKFNALPKDVVHGTKRILLDSIGCTVGGLSMDKNRIAVELAKRLEGPCESTIMGTGDHSGI